MRGLDEDTTILSFTADDIGDAMFDSFRAIVKKVDEDGGRKLIELSSIN